jgi:hypothetical protein
MRLVLRSFQDPCLEAKPLCFLVVDDREVQAFLAKFLEVKDRHIPSHRNVNSCSRLATRAIKALYKTQSPETDQLTIYRLGWS